MGSKLGMNSGSDVLPVIKTEEGPGLLGPDYDFSDNVPTPAEIGVSSGGSINHVLDAVKAVSWYTDMIGFGQATNSLSRGMWNNGREPYALGVNYFVKTGQKCPNGKEMFMYVEGIPKGDMLGPRVTKAMAQMGLPGLRGLGPGAVEDAENALDPRPILSAVFGSGYPDCEEVIKVVGDQNNRIKNPETGKYYVEHPETVSTSASSVSDAYDSFYENVYKFYKDYPAIIEMYKKQQEALKEVLNNSSVKYQKRWIQKLDGKGRPVFLTKEEYEAKSKCNDGSLIVDHINGDCNKDLTNPEEYSEEGFSGSFFDTDSLVLFGLVGLVILMSCLRK